MFRRGKAIECIIDNLSMAESLHEEHIEKPSTATDESQEELMEYIQKAKKCADEISIIMD